MTKEHTLRINTPLTNLRSIVIMSKEHSSNNDVTYYKAQIEQFRKQLEIANREVAKADHQREENEKKILEAHIREQQSRQEAEKYKKELAKTRDRYHTLENDLQINKLGKECATDENKILTLQATINDIETDPRRDLPINVDDKRRLPKLKLELQRLKSKHDSQSQLLENIEAMGNMTEAMQQAACRGDKTTVKRLLSRGVHVNVPDETGYTAFMYACGKGHTDIAELMISVGDAAVNDADSKVAPLILGTTNCHNEVVQLLLRHGAAVDHRDELACTPLLIACEKNSIECATTLLDAGANSNAVDKRGNTALHRCAIHGNADLAKLLMERGANETIKNYDFMTAVAIARSRRHFGVVDAIAHTK
ncbi:hypothetical protein HJC23_004167 [Cyclotella cryptica]|uniref:Uncharacterized protein n=1 Tax=Cyclotella cryptica TaxID=29204 RepID=A0ABD3NXG7_9STRA|eukprot:CCRYP_018978-RB/>CCRYP_018978-RB protein AED:0.18 eAED:0.18 QI:784/1/1/1/0.5/0.33/3/1364/364